MFFKLNFIIVIRYYENLLVSEKLGRLINYFIYIKLNNQFDLFLFIKMFDLQICLIGWYFINIMSLEGNENYFYF